MNQFKINLRVILLFETHQALFTWVHIISDISYTILVINIKH